LISDAYYWPNWKLSSISGQIHDYRGSGPVLMIFTLNFTCLSNGTYDLSFGNVRISSRHSSALYALRADSCYKSLNPFR
jgi:hypothetical protein